MSLKNGIGGIKKPHQADLARLPISNPQRGRKSGEGVNPSRQARYFTRRCILFKDALGDTTHQFRLGELKRPFSGGAITSINRHLDVFDSTPNSAAPVSVTFGPTFILTDTLFCGTCISHISQSCLLAAVRVCIARHLLRQAFSMLICRFINVSRFSKHRLSFLNKGCHALALIRRAK